jgi:hypothetical protein
MRYAVFAALCALAACTPQQKAAEAPAAPALDCNQSLTREIAVSAADAKDLLSIRTIAAPPLSEKAVAAETDMTEGGKLCTGAVVLVTLHRESDGRNLHSFIAPVTQLEMIEGHAGGPFTPAALQSFVKGWAEAFEVTTTDTAPALDPRGEAPVSTRFSNKDYAAVAGRKLPMFCYMETVHDRACLYRDPDAGETLQPFFSESKA